MKYLLFSLLFFLSSCGSFNGEQKDKNLSDRFNGENYDASLLDLIPAPLNILGIRKRKLRESLIKGTAYFSYEGTEYPLRYHNVILKNNKRIIKVGTTNNKGRFHIQGLFNDGPYKLVIKSKKYEGMTEVILKGYYLDKLKLLVRKN